ncbi:restriction endonuclease [Phaeobacter sp. HS012]|nr:restriction endonuclease [Phaeobacter inhibens]APX17631.1 restriction endonuclease [Phaeobacter inhibens]MBQ4807990.1 restriction endonuclease [Phaeobacter sp. HS012]MBQ4882839.1 restriction endonuclease [Phaeobacter sp. HS011]
MMLATVDALKSMGGSASIHELDEKVAELEGVSEAEQSFMMTGSNSSQPRLNYYLAWSRTFLKRGGALENSARGVWALTEAGYDIHSYDETKKIVDLVNEEEKARARERRRQSKPAATSGENLERLSSENDGEATDPSTESWRETLLEVLKAMDPAAFERLAQRLLREAGFTKVEVRGKSGDGGIDGVGVLRVNLVSFQVFFQCKRWKGSVGSSEIRDFRGAMMGRADKGLFITTGNFTAQASDEATRDGATAIDLIDGSRLCELLKDNKLGVATEMIESVKIDPNWFGTI